MLIRASHINNLIILEWVAEAAQVKILESWNLAITLMDPQVLALLRIQLSIAAAQVWTAKLPRTSIITIVATQASEIIMEVARMLLLMQAKSNKHNNTLQTYLK